MSYAQRRQRALGSLLYRGAKMGYKAISGGYYSSMRPKRFHAKRRRGMYRHGENVEVKFHDVTADVSPMPTTANTITDLLTIAQGDGESQREGRKITIKSIYTKFTCILPSTNVAASTGGSCNIWMVLDKQCNGVQLDAAQFLADVGDFHSFNDLANSNRYRVLWKRTYQLAARSGGAPATPVFGEHEISDQVYVKCNIQIQYDASANTGVIGTINSNNIAIIAQGRTGIIQFLSRTRFRFTDK